MPLRKNTFGNPWFINLFHNNFLIAHYLAALTRQGAYRDKLTLPLFSGTQSPEIRRDDRLPSGPGINVDHLHQKLKSKHKVFEIDFFLISWIYQGDMG